MHDTQQAKDRTSATEVPSSEARSTKSNGNSLLAMGLSVGAVGVAGAALGAVCPLCVIVTPALLGAGLVQRLRATRMERQAVRREAADGLDGDPHRREAPTADPAGLASSPVSSR